VRFDGKEEEEEKGGAAGVNPEPQTLNLESGPLRAVDLLRHKWPGGSVICCLLTPEP
jgi:hypothetical protein